VRQNKRKPGYPKKAKSPSTLRLTGFKKNKINNLRRGRDWLRRSRKGGRQHQQQHYPHSVRDFLLRSACASQLAPLPSTKNQPPPIGGGCAAADLAERAGFEPAIPFRVYTLSRRAPSTTRTPLLKGCKSTNSSLSFRIFFGRFASWPPRLLRQKDP
jgi:hypothetical protein